MSSGGTSDGLMRPDRLAAAGSLLVLWSFHNRGAAWTGPIMMFLLVQQQVDVTHCWLIVIYRHFTHAVVMTFFKNRGRFGMADDHLTHMFHLERQLDVSAFADF